MTPEQIQEQVEGWGKVRPLLPSLTRKQQEAIELVCIQGLSRNQAAKNLEITTVSLKNRLEHAFENLLRIHVLNSDFNPRRYGRKSKIEYTTEELTRQLCDSQTREAFLREKIARVQDQHFWAIQQLRLAHE